MLNVLCFLLFFYWNIYLIVSGAYEDPNEMSALSQVIDDEHMLKITSNFKRLGGNKLTYFSTCICDNYIAHFHSKLHSCTYPAIICSLCSF